VGQQGTHAVDTKAQQAKRVDGLERARWDAGLGESVAPRARLLLSLQESAGNRAVSGLVQRWRRSADAIGPRASTAAPAVPTMLVQRFPTRDGMVKKLGKPKRSARPGHGSKKYKAALDAVDDYNTYIGTTKLDNASAATQFGVVMDNLAKIETAANGYTGKTTAKATYMLQTLLPEVVAERALAAQTLLKVATGGFAQVALTQTIANAMVMSMGSARTLALSDTDAVGTDRGGMSEVTEFSMPGKERGFFKPNKETLTDLSGGTSDESALLDKLTKELPAKQVNDRFEALKNEYQLGVSMVGIDAKDARMANRDVAMSRIDTLLGADVIARAQLAVRTLPSGAKEKGSIMAAAKGTQAAKLMKKGHMASDAKRKAAAGKTAVNQQDPTLIRLLSKLQLIDLLCHQVDRNPKNFFIQTDATGKVTGITGIDNDLSLGTTKTIDKRKQELPGLSRYVDKELAQKILDLDVNVLAVILADLLSSAEIDAIKARFQTLQTHLSDKKTHLLDPAQWSAVADDITNEGKSYWADIEYNKGKYG
jgi:hypothetical protein